MRADYERWFCNSCEEQLIQRLDVFGNRYWWMCNSENCDRSGLIALSGIPAYNLGILYPDGTFIKRNNACGEFKSN